MFKMAGKAKLMVGLELQRYSWNIVIVRRRSSCKILWWLYLYFGIDISFTEVRVVLVRL